MKFYTPTEFEIPDDWLETSGLKGFVPAAPAYNAQAEPEWPNLILTFGEIVPPVRTNGVRWFDEERMTRILRGIVAGTALPRIQIHELPARQSNPYALRDGFHRFYASAAAGFRGVPVAVIPYFDITQA